MTDQDRAESLRAIEENPGFNRVFSCCDTWYAGEECPPAIFCPTCGMPMVDSNATVKELLDWRKVLEEDNGPDN